MKAYWGVEVDLQAFLTSALDGVESLVSRPDRFTPRERVTGTHYIGLWVGPRASLDAVVRIKIPSLCRDSNPPIIQLVTQRCTTELSRLHEHILEEPKVDTRKY
jgi:hypothetical protein